MMWLMCSRLFVVDVGFGSSGELCIVVGAGCVGICDGYWRCVILVCMMQSVVDFVCCDWVGVDRWVFG